MFLHQKNHAQDILKKFKMSNYNAVATPLETGVKLRKETNDEFVSVQTNHRILEVSLQYQTIHLSKCWIVK